MRLSEVLDAAIDAATSGMNGASVEILMALNEAIKGGKTDNFFVGSTKTTLINSAQQLASENFKRALEAMTEQEFGGNAA